jgi:2-dehydropantoate 2-reductase
VFVARGAHLEAMTKHGLRLESPVGGIFLPRVTATESLATVGFVDLVVFAVKGQDSEKAAAAITPGVSSATRVLTLQNGIDSVDVLSGFVPRRQIVGGATYISAYLARPGVIAHAGGLIKVIVGGRNDPLIDAFVAACLRAGRIDIEAADDIDRVLWTKFVTVSAFSGGTSLMRAGIGPILADPESRAFIEQLLHEGMAVASAAGHPMPDGFEGNVRAIWASFPSDTKSSMANDLARGRPIELAWLSGRMHALGEQLGVPTPAHTAVHRALHLHALGVGPMPHLEPMVVEGNA